jgi:hypothetical protein
MSDKLILENKKLREENKRLKREVKRLRYEAKVKDVRLVMLYAKTLEYKLFFIDANADANLYYNYWQSAEADADYYYERWYYDY